MNREPLQSLLPRLALAALVVTAACRSNKVPEPGSTSSEGTTTPSKPSSAGGPSLPVVPALPNAPTGQAPETTSEAAAPPPFDLPTERPRFALRGPLAAHVSEAAEQQGHRVQFTYFLDLCPGRTARRASPTATCTSSRSRESP